MPFKGQATEQTTGKLTITRLEYFRNPGLRKLLQNVIPFRHRLLPFQPRLHPPLYQAMKADHGPEPKQCLRYQTEVSRWARAARKHGPGYQPCWSLLYLFWLVDKRSGWPFALKRWKQNHCYRNESNISRFSDWLRITLWNHRACQIGHSLLTSLFTFFLDFVQRRHRARHELTTNM